MQEESATSGNNASSHEAHIPKKHNKKRFWLAASLLLIVILSVILAFFIAIKNRDGRVSIPDNISRYVNFPLYFPSSIPKEYAVTNQDHTFGGGVIISTIKAPLEGKITIAQQKLPDNLDLNTFFDDQVTQSRDIKTPIGYAKLGQLDKSSVVIITTDKTLLTINGIGVDEKDLYELAQKFAPFKQ